MIIKIPAAKLKGAAAGAGTMAVVVFAFAGIAFVMGSIISLGFSGNSFEWKKVGKGLAIYTPVGAGTGVAVVAIGASWWIAIPASVGVLSAISWIYQRRNRHQYR